MKSSEDRGPFFLNEPRAEPASGVTGHEGHFYVAGIALYSRYRRGSLRPNDFYLHTDGCWYRSALNESGDATGYFGSREAAEAALSQAVVDRHDKFEAGLDRMKIVERFDSGYYNE